MPHSPYAVHSHTPNLVNPDPQGPPGAIPPENAGIAKAAPVSQLNEEYQRREQVIHDRLEAESRGYDSVFAQ